MLKDTQTKKKTEGAMALVVAKQAGFFVFVFFFISAAGEMHKGQRVYHSIMFPGGQQKTLCMGKAWGRKPQPENSGETQRDQS